jgi:hypothetical protein
MGHRRAAARFGASTPTRSKRQLVGTIDTDVNGDRGLHGIAFHPDFPKKSQVYLFSHVHGTPGGQVPQPGQPVGHHAARGAESTLVPGSDVTIVQFDGDEAAQHVGGGLFMHPKERLLVRHHR